MLAVKLRLASLALAVALLGAFALPSIGASTAHAEVKSITFGCTVTPPGGGDPVNTTCTLNKLEFELQNGQLVLAGTLSALIGGVQTVLGKVAFPVLDLGANAACTILDLTLGPIDLELLGIRVQTNQIHLRISSTGTGLGALLCNLVNAFPDLTSGQLRNLLRLLNNLLNTGTLI